MDIIKNNLIWIISTLVAIGGFVALTKANTINMQEEINKIESVQDESCKKINTIDITLARIDSMIEDMKEMKSDIKDIKAVVYRPTYTYIDKK
jgi:hypothetical protein